MAGSGGRGPRPDEQSRTARREEAGANGRRSAGREAVRSWAGQPTGLRSAPIGGKDDNPLRKTSVVPTAAAGTAAAVSA